jgi:hypothetical protein
VEEIKQPAGDAAEKTQLRLDAGSAQVSYANFAVVATAPEEFVLNFGVHTGDEQVARVANKVILSPKNAKRLAATLAQSVRLFEEKFGTIDTSFQALRQKSAK